MKTLKILTVTFMEGNRETCGFKIGHKLTGNEIKVPYDNGGHFQNSVEKAAWVLQQQGFNIIGICGDQIVTDTFKEMMPHNYAYDKIGSTGLYHAFIAGHTAASEGMVKSNNRNEYFKDFHGGDIVKKEDVVKICNMLTIGSPTSEGSMYNQALTDILTQINSL